jgi:hypothetical protein
VRDGWILKGQVQFKAWRYLATKEQGLRSERGDAALPRAKEARRHIRSRQNDET